MKKLTSGKQKTIINLSKLNEYKWQQASMWEFSPKTCIEKYEKSSDVNHIFHYYLIKCVQVFNDNHWKTEVVESIDDVPENILRYINDEVYISNNNIRTKISI